MRVKNKYSSHLGFLKPDGKNLALMPGESSELPEGFDEKHPIVAFYIKKGWLEEVDESEVSDPPPVEENADTATDGETLLAKEFGVEVKKVARLKLAELQDKCADLGIGFDASETRADLFSKIVCHLKDCK